MKMKNKIPIILALLFQIPVFAAPPEDGKIIFRSRCASCHNVNKQLVGPALAGIDERRSMDWIIRFVNSSQSFIKNGDTAAMAVFEKFNKVPMPDHADLTAVDIKKIVDYIKSEASLVIADKAPPPPTGKKRDLYSSLFPKIDFPLFLGLVIVVILLIFAILFAVRVQVFKRKFYAGRVAGKMPV